MKMDEIFGRQLDAFVVHNCSPPPNQLNDWWSPEFKELKQCRNFISKKNLANCYDIKSLLSG